MEGSRTGISISVEFPAATEPVRRMMESGCSQSAEIRLSSPGRAISRSLRREIPGKGGFQLQMRFPSVEEAPISRKRQLRWKARALAGAAK